MKRHLTITALISVLLAVIAGSAWATYPGTVGSIAFGAIGAAGNVDIYAIKPDGTGLTKLTDAASFDACATYSPNGGSIAFCSDRSGTYQIWRMTADGKGEQQVTRSPYPALFPDFSPDGRRIAFQANDGGPAGEDIFVVSARGGKARRLTGAPGNDEFPVFSPDGKTIAFVSERKGAAQIWLMDAGDGKDQRALTRDATRKLEVDWHPDGRRLAYAASGDIWVMKTDGSGQRNLTRSPQPENGVAWSPDGRQIAYIRRDRANRFLYVMNADGSRKHSVGIGRATLVPAWQPGR